MTKKELAKKILEHGHGKSIKQLMRMRKIVLEYAHMCLLIKDDK